jgi:hypothetical protein
VCDLVEFRTGADGTVVRSVTMKNPAMMSWTMRWAPNPSATPTTVAGATNPVSGKPSRWTTSTAVRQ